MENRRKKLTLLLKVKCYVILIKKKLECCSGEIQFIIAETIALTAYTKWRARGNMMPLYANMWLCLSNWPQNASCSAHTETESLSTFVAFAVDLSLVLTQQWCARHTGDTNPHQIFWGFSVSCIQRKEPLRAELFPTLHAAITIAI